MTLKDPATAGPAARDRVGRMRTPQPPCGLILPRSASRLAPRQNPTLPGTFLPPTTDHRPPITDHRSPITFLPLITCHSSLATRNFARHRIRISNVSPSGRCAAVLGPWSLVDHENSPPLQSMSQAPENKRLDPRPWLGHLVPGRRGDILSPHPPALTRS